MRAFLAAAVVAALVTDASRAEPQAAVGFDLQRIEIPGAVLSGLARDGDDLLLTDLASGQILRASPESWDFAAVGPVLPHGADVIGDPTGPYRLAMIDGRTVVAQGWTPVDAEATPFDHALLAIGDDGAVEIICDDFWNPFAFLADGDGFVVVDAARNSLERVGPGCTRQALASFARLAGSNAGMRALSPTEFRSETYEVDAVPTAVVRDGDRFLVSLFGGFPFLAGAGVIAEVPLSGGEPVPVVHGLDAPVDLAFTADRELLVLEHGLFDQSAGFLPDSGRLVAIDPTGARTVLLEGLTRPATLLVWDSATLMVTELGGALLVLTRADSPAP